MKALVVPGVTDLNKGDQALVWESHRLAMDTGLFDYVNVLGAGDSPDEKEKMSGQSSSAGYCVIENILKHPRRGVHLNSNSIAKRFFYFLFLMRNALFDLVVSGLLIVSGRFSVFRYLLSQKILAKLDVIVSHDVLFVKGGGFLHSYGEKRDIYVFWYFLFYINLARFHGMKVVVLPNSFGPFKSFGVKKQLRRSLSHCCFVSSREHKSSEALNALLHREIPVYPDLGFYLSGDQSGRRILQSLGVKFSTKVVGVTVRPWRFPGAEKPRECYDKYISSVTVFIDHQINLGNEVVLINQSLGPNVNEDDRNAISDVLKNVTSTERVHWLNENLPCNVLHSVYSQLDLLLGTRFHSVIFSLSSHVPCLAIAYGGNKGQGIMYDAGLSDYVVDISDVDGDVLIVMYDTCMKNKQMVCRKIESYIDFCKEERSRLITDVIGGLRASH